MNKHRELFPYCQVTYWKDGIAADPDEEWTYCRVSPLGMYTFGEQTFQNVEADRYAKGQLIGFLEQAYNHGKSDAKREIRELLEIKEPRR